MTNIIIDLETLGQSPGCIILSIGAYCLETKETFYRAVSIDSNLKLGLTMDASTLQWWMKQSDDARKVFNEPSVTLNAALLALSQWMSQFSKVNVWGDGAMFDLSILEAAYRAAKLNYPWHYTQCCCYRTLKKLFPQFPKPRTGTYHRADDDARTNGEHLDKILFFLRSRYAQ